MVQSGVTDIHTADVLSDFYINIEERRWNDIAKLLVDDLEYCVPAVFKTSPKANEKDVFVKTLKQWCYRYKESLFDVEWANISTDHAMVKFSVLCNGMKIVDALSEYKFDQIGDEVKIKSIYNHGMETLPLQMFEKSLYSPKNGFCVNCRLTGNCIAEKMGKKSSRSSSQLEGP